MQSVYQNDSKFLQILYSYDIIPPTMASRLERGSNDARRHGCDIVDEGLQRLIEGRKRLVEILSAVRAEPGKKVWTPALAKKINETVGQNLEDQTRINSLILPTKEQYSKKGFDPSHGFGQAGQVGKKTLFAYNSALWALCRVGIGTLGGIRDIQTGHHYGQWVGPNRLETFNLVKTAFDRTAP
jgi:hypothetical protein